MKVDPDRVFFISFLVIFIAQFFDVAIFAYRRLNKDSYHPFEKVLESLRSSKRLFLEGRNQVSWILFLLFLFGVGVFYDLFRDIYVLDDSSPSFLLFGLLTFFVATLMESLSKPYLLRYAYKAKIDLIALKQRYGIELTEEERAIDAGKFPEKG